jgi:hypothetical protein
MQFQKYLNINVTNNGVNHSLSLEDEHLENFADVIEKLLPVFGSLGFAVSMAVTEDDAIIIVPTALEEEFEDMFDDEPVEEGEWFNPFPADAEKTAYEDDYFAEPEIVVGDIVFYTGEGTEDEECGYGGYDGDKLYGHYGRVEEKGCASGIPSRFLVRWFGWSDGHGDGGHNWWVERDNLKIVE